ncbi:hydroxymethylbilane synthase [Neobittarella massiliensis]|uniref:hydroxymethylbilane synthase n=1 Tax=Neobittarella massiliensis (ex Bilen et al. 2018) TaxID=2041842 RepID=UPI000CF68B96|nr:hydroxymethylbilane synthase [Neobittarella massiliensis]
MKITVASRESRLAVIQSQLVMEAIKAAHPEIELELLTMKTTGDKILDRTLDKIGGKGLFVKELDKALLEGRADLTVHSYKDMPMEEDPALPVVAVSPREDPRDVLILPLGAKELDPALPLGCASARRRIQLQKLYPHMQVKPVRGNVLTRLQKLDRGEYSGLVLAYAGIKRLGLQARIAHIYSVTQILPAACQGVMAVQARRDFDATPVRAAHDPLAKVVCDCERSFVRTLDGGCSSPVAAYATVKGDIITLTGLFAGEGSDDFAIDSCRGPIDRPVELGQTLAEKMRGAFGGGR